MTLTDNINFTERVSLASLPLDVTQQDAHSIMCSLVKQTNKQTPSGPERHTVGKSDFSTSPRTEDGSLISGSHGGKRTESQKFPP